MAFTLQLQAKRQALNHSATARSSDSVCAFQGQAAGYLNCPCQSRRLGTCRDDGPVRANGRLAWPVAAIRALLGVTQ